MTPQAVEQTIEWLYDYGESSCTDAPVYLEELGLVVCREDRLVITEKWIRFSGRLKCVKQDIVNALLCFEPSLLDFLLAQVYHDAQTMAERGDTKALFEFVDALPLFAERLLPTSGEPTPNPSKEGNVPTPNPSKEGNVPTPNPSKEGNVPTPNPSKEGNRTLLEVVFGTPYPQYGVVMQVLKKMQQLEEVEDRDCAPLGKTPDAIWLSGRKISSNIALKPLDVKNRFSLTPYIYNDRPQEKVDVKTLLSEPWKVFLLRLGLVISGYKVEGLEVISLRPEHEADPFAVQRVLVSIFDKAGREVEYGNLNQFVYDLCQDQGLSLFPDCPSDVQQELFTLIGESIFTYRDGEYLLEEAFDQRVFREEFLLKNRTQNLRKMIKSFIEKCREEL